jgi:hypothetical protein
MDVSAFARLSPTAFSDVLTRERVMDYGIRPVWQPIPRIAGPAYPVRCGKADNLMLHAAIHRASPGAVIVVEAGDCDYAMSGGNVCAWAQRRGIADFVADGVVRDVAEVRALGFPVFARGVMPIPGGKDKSGVLNGPVLVEACAWNRATSWSPTRKASSSSTRPGAEELLRSAEAKAAKDVTVSLEQWAAAHRRRIDETLRQLGYTG